MHTMQFLKPNSIDGGDTEGLGLHFHSLILRKNVRLELFSGAFLRGSNRKFAPRYQKWHLFLLFL